MFLGVPLKAAASFIPRSPARRSGIASAGSQEATVAKVHMLIYSKTPTMLAYNLTMDS